MNKYIYIYIYIHIYNIYFITLTRPGSVRYRNDKSTGIFKAESPAELCLEWQDTGVVPRVMHHTVWTAVDRGRHV